MGELKRAPTRTAFKKGEKKPNQGKRGPNKVTSDVRAMVLDALGRAGGADYLVKQAKSKNPAAFLALVGKCIPKDINLKAELTLADLLREAENRRKAGKTP